ncbi:MAG TPA: hypothetical protein VD840_12140 [Sinorhizobium sp.]|nr:hypothetical protein [Sinorhizobium sp.]
MFAEMKIAQNAATPTLTPVQKAMQIPCSAARSFHLPRNPELMTAFLGFPLPLF